jgi:hypothetical protein
MVRFSDMLGGNGEPERSRPVSAADPALADEIPEPEAEPEPDEPGTEPESGTGPEPARVADETFAVQTPEEVLDRLTQYATSARASDPDAAPELTAPVPPSDSSEGADELAAAGDDLLPHAKADSRKRRRK